jgi:hypothetical protein
VRNLGRYTFITGALTVLVIPFFSAQTNERADQIVSEQVQAILPANSIGGAAVTNQNQWANSLFQLRGRGSREELGGYTGFNFQSCIGREALCSNVTCSVGYARRAET